MQLDFPLRITHLLHNNPPQKGSPPTTQLSFSGAVLSREDLTTTIGTEEGWDELKKRLRLEYNAFLETMRANLLSKTHITTEGLPRPDSAILSGLANLIEAGKRSVVSVTTITDEKGVIRLEIVLVSVARS
jgi:hypothetical protein